MITEYFTIVSAPQNGFSPYWYDITLFWKSRLLLKLGTHHLKMFYWQKSEVTTQLLWHLYKYILPVILPHNVPNVYSNLNFIPNSLFNANESAYYYDLKVVGLVVSLGQISNQISEQAFV